MNIKKIIAPIIVTIILVTFILLFIVDILNESESIWMRVIGTIIAFVFIVISIWNLLQRIKEIRGGEYDDLSKY